MQQGVGEMEFVVYIQVFQFLLDGGMAVLEHVCREVDGGFEGR